MILECQKSSERLLLSLEHVKTHLRINGPFEDNYLESLIKTATEAVESFLERSLLLKTYRLISKTETDASLTTLYIPKGPLQSIISVSHYFSDDEKRPIKRYMLTPNLMMPKLSVLGSYDMIEVVYKAGYGESPDSVPPAIRHAALECVAQFYESRGCDMKGINGGILALLQPYKVMACR